MAEHSSGNHSNDMEAHRSTYNAFIKGSIALSIHCGYVLVALCSFAFAHTFSVFIGFAGLIIGTIAIFIDVRTRAEAQFMGMATPVDALVPYVEFQEFMTDWDETRGFYKLEPFSDFVPEVGRRLQAKGLSKSDPVVLICRAGERSSRAANLLADSGYSRVYTVVYGFEGELSDKGRRNVNGWKNANLPWSFELDKSKMYFPR